MNRITGCADLDVEALRDRRVGGDVLELDDPAARDEAARRHVLGEAREAEHARERPRHDVRAGSLAPLDEALGDERVHRRPDGHPRDAPAQAQLALARQAIADMRRPRRARAAGRGASVGSCRRSGSRRESTRLRRVRGNEWWTTLIREVVSHGIPLEPSCRTNARRRLDHFGSAGPPLVDHLRVARAGWHHLPMADLRRATLQDLPGVYRVCLHDGRLRQGRHGPVREPGPARARVRRAVRRRRARSSPSSRPTRRASPATASPRATPGRSPPGPSHRGGPRSVRSTRGATTRRSTRRSSGCSTSRPSRRPRSSMRTPRTSTSTCSSASAERVPGGASSSSSSRSSRPPARPRATSTSGRQERERDRVLPPPRVGGAP